MLIVPAGFAAMPRWQRDGQAWLESLPWRVERQCRRWGLTLDDGRWYGSNALVIAVRRHGEPLALRLTPPGCGFADEVAALEFWNGRGTVLLVDAELEAGAMLLERLDPTRSLCELPLDECSAVLGSMMRQLAVPAPSTVPSTGEVVSARLATMEADWQELGRPVSADMFAEAVSSGRLLTEVSGDRAVNADLHAGQIIGGTRERWLTVDPRLLRGDIGYDLARCLWDRLDDMPDAATINEQLVIIADAAGLDHDHARRTALFRTVDYWLWGLRNGLTEDPLRCERLSAALLG